MTINKKKRELINYAFWGVLATFLNYIVYFVLTESFDVNYINGDLYL